MKMLTDTRIFFFMRIFLNAINKNSGYSKGYF